jgi:hypothetical protein
MIVRDARFRSRAKRPGAYLVIVEVSAPA